MRNTMIKKLSIHLAILVGFAAAAHSVGAAIVVDGNLSDWGVVVKTGVSGSGPIKLGGTDYSGLDHVSGLVGTYIEDTDDLRNNYFLGPNYGGQNYDAEMMAVAVQDNNLFIAILSGQRPDNGLSTYSPGDIRITTLGPDGNRVFGIEVGGGKGGTSAAGIITDGDNGSFYMVKDNGYTEDVNPDPSTKAGELWETTNATDTNAGWIYDPINPFRPVQLQPDIARAIGGGILLGMADYVFTRNSAVDVNGLLIEDDSTHNPDKKEHSVIELSLALSAFDLGDNEKIISIEWRPSCGNDELIVSPTGGFGPNDIPEPASILVWGLLSVACAGFGFRRRSRRCVE